MGKAYARKGVRLMLEFAIWLFGAVIGFSVGYFVGEFHAINEIIEEGHKAMEEDIKQWGQLLDEKWCG